MKPGLLVFYFIQNEPGEDISHPNLYELPATQSSNPTLREVVSEFALRNSGQFHWRFRAQFPQSKSYVWVDVKDPSAKVPLYGGNVFAKLLRLDNLSCSSIKATRRVGVSLSAAKLKTPIQRSERFNQAKSKPVSKNQASKPTRKQSSEADDLIDMSNSSAPQAGVGRSLTPVPVSGTGMPSPTRTVRPQSSGESYRSDLDGLSAEDRAKVRIQEREAAEREKQRKAVEEVRDRDAKQLQAEEDRSRVAKQLGAKLVQWSGPEGDPKNIRALLGTLHNVLWDGAKWQPVSVLVRPLDVKKAYRKSMLLVHPDKVPKDAPPDVKFIAQRCFEALNTQFALFSAKEIS